MFMNLERTKKIVAIGGGLNGRVTEDGKVMCGVSVGANCWIQTH